MKFIAKLCVFLFVITQITTSFAQLSKKHYIPPLTFADSNSSVPQDHYFYISTPKNKDVNFTIKYIGNPTSDVNGKVSRSNPVAIVIGSGVTQLFIEADETSKKITNKGFIIEADDVIYVSVRILASNGFAQAGALVSKGASALGTTFRAGMFTNESGRTQNANGTFSENLLSFISVLATEDDTTVDFSGISNNTEIQNGTSTFPYNILLNEGESYTIAMNSYSTSFPENNKTGLIGALIESDKNIVVNVGSSNGSFHNGNGRDYGIDQIVDISKVGSEYILVKGDGNDNWENVLVVAHEDDTTIKINDNKTFGPIDAGEYVVIEGEDYSSNGNMYLETNKPVFVYQGVGANNSEANQSLFFVPPLSCENRGNINSIPNIENIGSLNFSGGITIVTTKGATVDITSDTQTFTPQGPFDVTGNSEYVTYKANNLTGNISINSTGELYCAYFNQNGSATSGSFYSGFPTAPEINFNTTVSALGNCIPNLTLQAANTDLFDSIQWEFLDTTTSTWVIKDPNANYKPTEPGTYRLIGKIICSNSTFESIEIPVSICPDDYDGDLVIDNLDTDLDNDGILNCDESLGNVTVNLSDIDNAIALHPETNSDIINTNNFTASDVTNTVNGDNTGNFETKISPVADSKLQYELKFTQNVNFTFTQNKATNHTISEGEFFILKIGPSNKNVTLLDPDDQLLVDTNFDGEFESGVTYISASEIHFKYRANNTGTSSTFQFLANQINQFDFKHQSTTITSQSTFNGNLILHCFSLDSDGDGIENMFDIDSDNDGVPDIYDAYGIQFTLTNTDFNLDGLDDIFDSATTNLDTDNDNIKNYLDYDSDNDGIFDSTEAGHNLDINLDGTIDNYVDTNNNGLDDRLEDAATIINYTIEDSDSDLFFNFVELDADDDDCLDVTEAGFSDINDDGYLGDIPLQVDANGKVMNSINGYTMPNSNYAIPTPIEITKFEDTTFCEENNEVITIESNADSFKWQFSKDGITWTTISNNGTYSGATSNMLRMVSTPLSFNNNQYRVILGRTGNVCPKTSNAIKIVVNPKPIVLNNIVQLKQCADDPSEITTVNLTEAEVNISTDPTVTFEYYETEAKALTGGTPNQITNQEQYPVNRTAEAWVRTVSDKDCFTISKIEITATFVSDITYDKTFEECDDLLDADGRNTINNSESDGISNFNFSVASQEIKALFPNPNDIEVFYFETIADRDASTNPIPDITKHRNNNDVSYAYNQTIYVKIKNKNNNDCEGLGKLFLKTSAIPAFSVIGEAPDEPILVCAKNLPYTLMAENPQGDYRYVWEDENGNKIGASQNQAIGSGGDYTVTAFSKNSKECSKSRTITVIQSNPAVLNESYVTISDEVLNPSTTNLSVIISIPQNPLSPEQYLYSLERTNGLVVRPPQEINIFTNIEGGIYNLIVENKNGCGTSELIISVIQFPKFFTPNGDGENDSWLVKGVDSSFYSEISMTVFDRYGKLIYRMEDLNLGWDGTFNGRKLANGDYWYHIVLIPTDTSKPIIERKGNFSLLR